MLSMQIRTFIEHLQSDTAANYTDGGTDLTVVLEQSSFAGG